VPGNTLRELRNEKLNDFGVLPPRFYARSLCMVIEIQLGNTSKEPTFAISCNAGRFSFSRSILSMWGRFRTMMQGGYMCDEALATVSKVPYMDTHITQEFQAVDNLENNT